MTENSRPRIGIRSSSLLGDDGFRPPQLLALRAAGFDLIELNFNHPRNQLDPADVATASLLRAVADEAGIELVAHAPDAIPISLPDSAAALANAQVLGKLVEEIAGWGCTCAVVHACGYEPLHPGREDEQFRNLVESLRVLAIVAERVRLRLALETLVPGRLCSKIDRLIAAVDEVGSAWLGICLDTNHSNLSEDIAAAAVRAGHRLFEVHLNDNQGEREQHLLPYSGIIDWEAFTGSVAAIGFDGLLVMEPTWGADEDPHAMLAESRAVADRLADDIVRQRPT